MTGDEAEVTRDATEGEAQENSNENEEVAVDDDASNKSNEEEVEVDDDQGCVRQPRTESRGSKCSDYEQWVADNLLLPDLENEELFDYNPAEASTALRMIDLLPRDSAGRIIEDPKDEKEGDGQCD